MPEFGSLNIAFTGLKAHEKRISTIGENIANVNTPGYHRQRVELSPIDNVATGHLSGRFRAGAGVEVSDVARLRDEILSDHARHQSGVAASRAETAETMLQIEQTVGGLNPGGLHDQMTALFNSFDDLSGSPEDPAMRGVVLQRAENVVQGFNRTVEGIDRLHQRSTDQVTDTVRKINSIAEQIAIMDVEVAGAINVGADPNTLLDKRDAMVSELSALAAVNVVEDQDGQVAVSIDGYLLVTNGRSRELSITTTADAALGALGYGRLSVVDQSGRELNVAGGALSAGLNAVNQVIPDGRRDVDAVALDLATQVNAIHQGGAGLDSSTGLNMFEVSASGLLTMSADVEGQPDKIAAATAGSGLLDNSNARQMAQLADIPTGPLANFVETVGTMAAKVASATGSAEAAQAASAQADNLAMAAGGVSLDEELTDLITAQRSYEASARLMTAIDEMIQTLINRTGLVGR
ncbi:MAG: flagellar hook-associated protein FlgK [Acidimicrobiales bacterium]